MLRMLHILVTVHDLLESTLFIVFLEGWHSESNLIHEDSQPPIVNALVVDLTFCHLGCHEYFSSLPCFAEVFVHIACYAQVSKQDLSVLWSEKNIVALEVPVDEVFVVKVFQCTGKNVHHVLARLLRELFVIL